MGTDDIWRPDCVRVLAIPLQEYSVVNMPETGGRIPGSGSGPGWSFVPMRPPSTPPDLMTEKGRTRVSMPDVCVNKKSNLSGKTSHH